MKPARLGYHRAASVAEAQQMLAVYEGTARLLAGGQSLVPMLNLRLLRPDAVIDINEVEELRGITEEADRVRIGAMVRYRELEASPVVARRLPLVARALHHIGDRQVRNRGTIGGSLVHGDPTGEMPLACLVLGAVVHVVGPAGTRTVELGDLYVDSYAAALDPLEVLTEVEIPAPSHASAFVELCRRHNDFAVISVACVGRRGDDGRWSGLRLGLGGMAATPVLAAPVTDALEGSTLGDDEIEAAATRVLECIDPPSDIRASAEYRRHLAPVYVARALRALRDDESRDREGI